LASHGGGQGIRGAGKQALKNAVFTTTIHFICNYRQALKVQRANKAKQEMMKFR